MLPQQIRTANTNTPTSCNGSSTVQISNNDNNIDIIGSSDGSNTHSLIGNICFPPTTQNINFNDKDEKSENDFKSLNDNKNLTFNVISFTLYSYFGAIKIEVDKQLSVTDQQKAINRAVETVNLINSKKDAIEQPCSQSNRVIAAYSAVKNTFYKPSPNILQ
ncbi:MAG: hypothetical protein ABF461_03600 [Zymomonas mobilis subsp. pomaceae]|uniref:hypothetical protein n=1 Tax=Zymomonas mobilis TaxID=542 RepID=UPI0039E96D89